MENAVHNPLGGDYGHARKHVPDHAQEAHSTQGADDRALNAHAVQAANARAQDEHQSLPILGFWIFLATDMILFACLFATYMVLRTHVDGGPTGASLFDIPGFTAETFILLTSSFTSGLATLAMQSGSRRSTIGWLVVTAALGAAFVGMEISEFVRYAAEGATMQRSAFLSAFFTLVGTHGAHVTLGLFWMIGIMLQLGRRGITPVTARKVFVVGLYWHFLDVVWIFIFTSIYLLEVVL